MVDKIKQVARLIRSKGVSVWFVTQNPADIPDDVLGQIGNRIQHALRGYTPKEQKAIRASADAFRPNPAFDTEDIISQLGVGEALVSMLDSKGIPKVVGQTLIRPPASRIGPVQEFERAMVMDYSPVKGIYDDPIDRKSAYEIHAEKRETAKENGVKIAQEEKAAASKAKKKTPSKKTTKKSSSRKKKIVGKTIAYEAKLVARQIARTQGRRILRGVLGTIMRR